MALLSSTYVLMRLLVNCGYQARAGGEVGLLDLTAQDFLIGEIKAGLPDPIEPVKVLEECDLLAPRPDGMYCARFARLNAHLAADFKPMARRGGDHRGFEIRQKRSAAEVGQISLLLGGTDPQFWTDENGAMVSKVDQDAVLLLIAGCDNALRRNGRQSSNVDYPQSLIRSALSVLAEVPNSAQRMGTLKKIVSLRGNPALPVSTEQLLAPGASGKSRFFEITLMP